MSWPELANKVMWQGRPYKLHSILGGDRVGIVPIVAGQPSESVGRHVAKGELENPDDCWCSECDSYTPETERMKHPGPDGGWMHTTCAGSKQRDRDVVEAREAVRERVAKYERKMAGKLHPHCRGRAWCPGDRVLVPMRVVGADRAFGQHCLLVEPAGSGQRVDEFGAKYGSVLVRAASVLPNRLAGLKDEALIELADAVAAERLARKW